MLLAQRGQTCLERKLKKKRKQRKTGIIDDKNNHGIISTALATLVANFNGAL